MPLNLPNQEATGPKLSERVIMFGEDDLDEEDFLKEIFSSLDPSVSLLFISNGRKLIAKLEQTEDGQLPRLIVLDYNMPELNGAEILKILKQNNRYVSIPKIVWSTSGSEIYRKLCVESGAVEYLIKPSNIKELEVIARRLLTFCNNSNDGF
ncbi:MAG: response regulator [Chitinophagaceae bacterium]